MLPISDVSGYETVIFPSDLTTVSTIPRAPRNSESTAGFWVQYPCSHQMYYEITIVKATASSSVQLGWTLFPNEEFTYSRADGVGNNSHSWSCDGIQKQKKGAPKGSLFRFHGGKQYSAIDLAQPWREGDTIGCLVDLKSKKMYCISMQAGDKQEAMVIFSDTDGFPEVQDPPVQLHPAISGMNVALRVNFGIDNGKRFRFSDKSLMTNLQKPILNMPIQPVFAWDDGQPVIPSFQDLTDIVFCKRLPPCVRAACNMLLKEIYFDQAPMHSEHIIEKTQVIDDRKTLLTKKRDHGADAFALNVSGDIEMSPTKVNPIQMKIGDAGLQSSGKKLNIEFEISSYVTLALPVLYGEKDLLYCLVQKDEDDAKTFLIHLISCIKHFLTFRSAFPAKMLTKIEADLEMTCNRYFKVVRRAKKLYPETEPSTHAVVGHAVETAANLPPEYKKRFDFAAIDSTNPDEPAANDFQNWKIAFEGGLSGALLIQICQLMSFGWDIKYASILSEAFDTAANAQRLKNGFQQSLQQTTHQLLRLIENFGGGNNHDNFLENSLDVADLPNSGVRTSMFGLINRHFTKRPKLLELFDELQILDHQHEIDGFTKSKQYLSVLDSSVQWLRHCIADPTSLEWDNVPNDFSDRLGQLWDAIESLIALLTEQNDYDKNVALMSSWVAPDVAILFMRLDVSHAISRDEIEPYEPTRA